MSPNLSCVRLRFQNIKAWVFFIIITIIITKEVETTVKLFYGGNFLAIIQDV